MTQETIEGNKLIATFVQHPEIQIFKQYNQEQDLHLLWKSCKYHSSWNWQNPRLQQAGKGNERIFY